MSSLIHPILTSIGKINVFLKVSLSPCDYRENLGAHVYFLDNSSCVKSILVFIAAFFWRAAPEPAQVYSIYSRHGCFSCELSARPKRSQNSGANISWHFPFSFFYFGSSRDWIARSLSTSDVRWLDHRAFFEKNLQTSLFCTSFWLLRGEWNHQNYTLVQSCNYKLFKWETIITKN